MDTRPNPGLKLVEGGETGRDNVQPDDNGVKIGLKFDLTGMPQKERDALMPRFSDLISAHNILRFGAAREGANYSSQQRIIAQGMLGSTVGDKKPMAEKTIQNRFGTFLEEVQVVIDAWADLVAEQLSLEVEDDDA